MNQKIFVFDEPLLKWLLSGKEVKIATPEADLIYHFSLAEGLDLARIEKILSQVKLEKYGSADC